ncbi:MAG: 4'-phosphopantetheinyl transferase family protein [Francisellaceae bacterium]
MPVIYCLDLNAVNVEPSWITDEILEASRSYKNNDKRREFIASQWLRRKVLSRHLGISARELQFYHDDRGRPFVLYQDATLDFNISHSGSWLVMAISESGKLGVDIERIKRRINTMEIAKRYFSEDEFQWLWSLPENERDKGFYRLWTLKEASLKLTGQGIAHGLDQHVFFIEDHICCFPESNNNYHSFIFFDDYILSICCEDTIDKIHWSFVEQNGSIQRLDQCDNITEALKSHIES